MKGFVTIGLNKGVLGWKMKGKERKRKGAYFSILWLGKI